MTYHTPMGIPPERKLYRLYDIWYKGELGQITHAERKLPARPVFEISCAAMGRGTLIDTPDGRTAIEDLHPGDFVQGWDGIVRIEWIGSTVMVPNLPQHTESTLTHLTRVQTSVLSQQVQGDLVIGPLCNVARRLPEARDPNMRRIASPAEVFGDSMAIQIQPPGSIRLYQLMLSDDRGVCSNGIMIETLCQDHLAQTATADDWPLLAQLFTQRPSFAVAPTARLTAV